MSCADKKHIFFKLESNNTFLTVNNCLADDYFEN